MNRRSCIEFVAGASAALTAATLSITASAHAVRKPCIIMVHGSWHWGGCFGKVSNLLAERGYVVATPDLASHGYSDIAYDSFSTMETYVAPVETLLRESKERVTLVGHSMGGVTLTYLAEKYPDKVRKLIYLTAFMVPNGKRALDYILLNTKLPEAAELFQIVSQVNGGKGLKLDMTKPDLLKAAFYGDCSDHDVGIARRNVLETGCTVADVAVSQITAARFSRIPRVYIECTRDKAIPIDTQRLMVKDVPGAKVVSLDTSHSAFFCQPERLAAVISENA